MPMIFVGMKYTDYEAYTFKFTKDAEMEIDSDLRTGVLQKISKGVKSRKKGEPLRFVYDATTYVSKVKASESSREPG